MMLRARKHLKWAITTGAAAALAMVLMLPTAYADTITIAGASIPTDSIIRPVQAGFEKTTGNEIRLVEGIFPEIYQDLVDGKVDAYVTTLPFDDAINDLKAQGTVPTDEIKRLHSTELARVPLAVFVNKGNDIQAISAEQFTAVLSGKVERWQALTGKNLPIRPIILSGYKVPLSYQFLGGSPISPNILLRDSVKDVMLEAIRYKNILAVLPESAFPSGLKKIKGPEMIKAAILVTRGEPSEKVKKLVRYIQGEGKKDVKLLH